MSNTLPIIVIVENDPSTLELYHRELSRDFRVIACFNKIEALAAIDVQSPKAIILELGVL